MSKVGRLHGRPMFTEAVEVALDASGNGTAVVTLPTNTFVEPAALVVPNRADEAAGATFVASSITGTSVTITITGSQLTNSDLIVSLVVVEKD